MKPRTIGRYLIKAELNRGGMSVVYLAHDPRFGRDVAIKMLPRSLQDQPFVRARFEREARTIAALEHPAIVPVYDFGEEDGQPYLVMRHMPGGSLADLLTYGRLNLPDASRIMQRLASALDEAHERNIIHRDLKPGNILFDTHGDAFLTDFGIVKLYEGEGSAQTLTGSVVLGTPAYMSPEQALGKTIDRRSDVYSLGAVLYETLTGLPPYKGPTGISVAMKHVVEPVPNLREHRPELPDACIAVVARAMAKEPDDRFETAGELASAFAQAVAGAAMVELMMPPVVVRKKPQTTSSAARFEPAEDEITPTTEWTPAAQVPQATPAESNGGGARVFVTAAALVALFFVGSLGVFVYAMTQRSNAAPPPISTTVAPGSTLTVLATTPVPTRAAPTPGATPSATAAAVLPTTEIAPTATMTTAPEPVRLRVTQDFANVRRGPAVQFEPPIARLRRGAELTPLSVTRQRDGNWFLIRLPDGRDGFIFEGVVQVLNPEALSDLPAVVVIMTPPAPATAPPRPTPTEVVLPTPTETVTPTPTPTETLTPTPEMTATPVPLPDAPTITPTPSIPPSPTPAPTLTPTPSVTPTVTNG